MQALLRKASTKNRKELMEECDLRRDLACVIKEQRNTILSMGLYFLNLHTLTVQVGNTLAVQVGNSFSVEQASHQEPATGQFVWFNCYFSRLKCTFNHVFGYKFEEM
jgi:hypothetical protein